MPRPRPVLYAVLSTDGEQSTAVVYGLVAAGILLELLPIFVKKVFENDIAVTLAGWASVILYAEALVLFVQERVQWLYALLSKMEVAPLTPLFPITIAVFVITVIIQMISLYCSNGGE